MGGKAILEITLHRKYFAEVAAGTKKKEYRKRKQYWKTRLEGRDCDVVRFRNGYSQDAAEVTVQFRGVRRQGKEYIIRLGKIISIKRWKLIYVKANSMARYGATSRYRSLRPALIVLSRSVAITSFIFHPAPPL